MKTLNIPSIFVPLAGLVFLAMVMPSLFLHIKKRFFRSGGIKSRGFFFKT